MEDRRGPEAPPTGAATQGRTEFFFSDHVLMYAAYPMPEEHAHLALHLIVAPGGIVRSRVHGTLVEGPAMLIASDVPHTA